MALEFDHQYWKCCRNSKTDNFLLHSTCLTCVAVYSFIMHRQFPLVDLTPYSLTFCPPPGHQFSPSNTMPLTEEQKARFQDFLQDSLEFYVSKALKLQPTIRYYVLALDCNIQENCEICTALNDPKSFQDTAEKYYADRDPEYLRTEIKYNSGDFNNSSARIEALDLFPNQILEDSQCQSILNELLKQMVIFMENPKSSYHSIPKTDNFKVIVYDHDQDPSVAFQAQHKLYPKPEFYLG